MTVDHEKNFGFLIQDVARLMKCAFDRRIKELGLTRSQWFAIAFLRRSDGLTQQQLADQMDIERAPLSKILTRLEKTGWIRKVPDAHDKRANRIFLSEEIQDTLPQLQHEAEELINYTLGDLSEKSRTQFIDNLCTAKSRLLAEINNPHNM
jgi:DNA-binding MarR family transcriptional regulator